MVKLIRNTFIKHPISENGEVNFFLPTKEYPNSEGIKFDSNEFSGEIFYYNYSNEYIEIEVLNKNTIDFSFKIIDINSNVNISNLITKFLDEVLSNLD